MLACLQRTAASRLWQVHLWQVQSWQDHCRLWYHVCCNKSDCCCECWPDVLTWWLRGFLQSQRGHYIHSCWTCGHSIVSDIGTGVDGYIGLWTGGWPRKRSWLRQRVRFIAGRRPAILHAFLSALPVPQSGFARSHNTNPICIGIGPRQVCFFEKWHPAIYFIQFRIFGAQSRQGHYMN